MSSQYINNQTILKLNNITKKFPGVLALDRVNFELEKGEIHILLGENGAGKSTLVKTIAGYYLPDYGTIELNGKEININSPSSARGHGIYSIYQEWNAFQDLTVAENIFVGNMPRKNLLFVDWKECFEQSKKLMSYLDVEIDPRLKMSDLSSGEQQIIEIIRCINSNAKIMIMDEPTSSLGSNEIKSLFKFIRSIITRGISVVFISHKLDEIFEIGDRVTVLRDGKIINTLKLKDTNEKELISMMAGEVISLEKVNRKEKKKLKEQKVVLEIRNLSKGYKLKNINISLKKGEILGVFGLVGAGQKELVNAISGFSKPDTGKIFLEGIGLKLGSILTTKRKGIGVVPSDKKLEGIISCLNISSNITLANIKGILKRGFINSKLERAIARKWIDKLNIKPIDSNVLVNNLSGGNQQKVVLAKWLENKSKVLILNEPTQGVDVIGKAEIHNIIRDSAFMGVSILLFTTEVYEVINLSDRIEILYKGEIVKEIEGASADKSMLMYYASGGK